MKDAKDIIFQDPKKTLLEIMKVHNKEVPFANLLAYFFRPEETHGLGTLFIDSFLETTHTSISENGEGNNLNRKSKVKVLVEVPTTKEKETKISNEKRIDLLIVTDTFVICIEFKINHDLDNPLQNYKDFIEEKYLGKEKFYFVLTPFKKNVPKGAAKKYYETNNDFKQIILSHFVENVKKNLPKHFTFKQEKNGYYQYFEEFIQTVENRKIRSERRKALNEISDSLSNKGLGSIYHSNNQGGFVEIKKGTKAVKVRIKPEGWQIEKWENNVKQSSIINIKRVDLETEIIELTNSFLVKESADLLT